MQIEVRLFATLRENRGKILRLDVDEGTSVLAVMSSLEISTKDVAILLVNGRDADLNRVLAAGDAVSIFPPVGGG